MRYICPICGFPDLDELPRYFKTGGTSLEYCPSCLFQFGWHDDDQGFSYWEWRQRWIRNGMVWREGLENPPPGWNPDQQLRTMRFHMCPVCGFPELSVPPTPPEGGASYEICPSCHFQFGYSDKREGHTYKSWQAQWITDGMPWKGTDPPPDKWNPNEQLNNLQPKR